MSISLLNSLSFLLKQTESERTISAISMVILVVMLTVLVIDSTAKYKSDYAPKSKTYKAFLLLFFFIAVGAFLILFRIYYK